MSDASGRKHAAISAPLVIRRTEQALPGALLLVIAFLWLAAAIYGLVANKPAVVPGLGIAGPYLAGALGVALAILALDWMLRGQAVLIARGAVAVTGRSLFGSRTWREPLAKYGEIRADPEHRTHPAGGARSWYVVRLWHPEPAKAIDLARTKDPARIERLAQDWARRLSLPLSSCHPYDVLDEATRVAEPRRLMSLWGRPRCDHGPEDFGKNAKRATNPIRVY